MPDRGKEGSCQAGRPRWGWPGRPSIPAARIVDGPGPPGLELFSADHERHPRRVVAVHARRVEGPVLRRAPVRRSVLGQLDLAEPTTIGPDLHQVDHRGVVLVPPAAQIQQVPADQGAEARHAALGVPFGPGLGRAGRCRRSVDVGFVETPRLGLRAGGLAVHDLHVGEGFQHLLLGPGVDPPPGAAHAVVVQDQKTCLRYSVRTGHPHTLRRARQRALSERRPRTTPNRVLGDKAYSAPGVICRTGPGPGDGPPGASGRVVRRPGRWSPQVRGVVDEPLSRSSSTAATSLPSTSSDAPASWPRR